MKKILVVVFNSLDTDSRVQRASMSLTELGDVEVIGIDKNFYMPNIKSHVIHLKSRNNFLRYYEFIFKIKREIKSKSFDIFYANDFYSAELVQWVKRVKRNVKIVYDAHELYIPEPGKPLNLRFNFFYKKEKRAIHTADLVICANDERADIMKEHFDLKEKPLVIRNISQLPIKDCNSKKYSAITNEFLASPGITVVYAGVLSSSRKLEMLIDVVKSYEHIKLLIVGEGENRNYLEEKAHRVLGERVMFTGKIPYTDLGFILRKCDIGYLYYPVDIINNIYCAPNKIYEYSSVKLPMIANSNPTVKRIFQEGKIGVASDDLAGALEQILSKLDEYKNNCELFNQDNMWDSERGKLISGIRGLI